MLIRTLPPTLLQMFCKIFLYNSWFTVWHKYWSGRQSLEELLMINELISGYAWHAVTPSGEFQGRSPLTVAGLVLFQSPPECAQCPVGSDDSAQGVLTDLAQVVAFLDRSHVFGRPRRRDGFHVLYWESRIHRHLKNQFLNIVDSG